jgi:hypothetical protein
MRNSKEYFADVGQNHPKMIWEALGPPDLSTKETGLSELEMASSASLPQFFQRRLGNVSDIDATHTIVLFECGKDTGHV